MGVSECIGPEMIFNYCLLQFITVVFANGHYPRQFLKEDYF